jgi:roadblock/LC7 domain-containing protein
MADLNKLMSIPGAFAAGEFSPTGELINYTGQISLQAAKMAAQMCAANLLMAKMEAAGWTAYTGKEGFEPALGFAVSGPENSALIVGRVGVFVKNKDADFDKAFAILSSV